MGALRKQKGELVIKVTQLEAIALIMFDSPKCPKSLGFDIQIQSVTVKDNDTYIHIDGKAFDNLVIKQV